MLLIYDTLYGQDIPNYIFPNDLYQILDDVTKQKIVALNNEMKMGEDPSFESVSRIFPGYMDYPKAVVGVKEHHGRFLSSWDGSIIYPPFYLSFEVEGEGRKIISNPISFSNSDVKKNSNSLVGDYLPVINRQFEYEGLTYEQTLLAYSENFSTEKPLIAFVKMTVKNTLNVRKNCVLSLCFNGTGARPSSQIWATSGYEIVNCPMRLFLRGNKIINENGDVVLWTGDQEFFYGENRLSVALSLEVNEEKNCFCMPFEPINAKTTVELSKTISMKYMIG